MLSDRRCRPRRARRPEGPLRIWAVRGCCSSLGLAGCLLSPHGDSAGSAALAMCVGPTRWTDRRTDVSCGVSGGEASSPWGPRLFSDTTESRGRTERDTLFLLLGALCAARGGVPRECRVCHVERLSAAFLAPWRRTCPVPWCLWWGRLDGTTCWLATCGRPRARSAVRGRGGVSAACRCRLRSVGAWGGRHGGGTPGAWRTTGLFWSSDFGVLEPGSS